VVLERRWQESDSALDDVRLDPVGPGAKDLHAHTGRRRGRPPGMSSPELLDRIRRLAVTREGLFRVHRRHSSLYARARRSFGSWSAAVVAAGLDYREALTGARLRSLKTRRRRSRRSNGR